MEEMEFRKAQKDAAELLADFEKWNRRQKRLILMIRTLGPVLGGVTGYILTRLVQHLAA